MSRPHEAVPNHSRDETDTEVAEARGVGRERAALARALARRSHEALDFLVGNAPIAVLTAALEAPTATGGIARLGSALAGVDAGLPAADPETAAIARAAQQKAETLASTRTLSTADVAQVLGVSAQAVTKRRLAGRLLALPTAGGDYRYPAFQFTEEGSHRRPIVVGFEDALRALRDGGVESPWVQLQVLTTSTDALGGRSVADCLRSGDDDARAAAVYVAARYGDHGA